MEIMEIIKEAFVFPSKDIAKLAVYIVFAIVLGLLCGGGVGAAIVGIVGNNAIISVVGIILFVFGLILGFIVTGYQVSIVKSGIDLDEEVPAFVWKENLITGVKYLIMSIVYYIIPAIIIAIVGVLTNVPGNVYAIVQESAQSSLNSTMAANATAPAVTTVSNVLLGNLVTSLAITALVGLILVVIFSFIHTMGQARLANTGSLGEALNIPEAFRDLGRIGWGKVIATIILIAIIIAVINIIISFISYYVNGFGIISIIVSPYLLFFACRATGLLYSDIA